MLDAVARVLSPKQIRSIVGALDTPQIALWAGAVSSGKTIASLLAFLMAVAKAPDQGLIVVIGRTLQTIERNLIDPLQSSTLFGPFAGQVHHTPGSTTAVIFGRTVHLVGASDVRAEARIRGSTIALAYVDEATLVPQSFWMMLLSRLRVPGAKLLATTNPDGPAHWLRRDFILRGPQVGVRHWHFTLDDNPSLTAEYVARLKAQYVGLWHRRFIAGEWCLAQGAIYDMWDPDRHVIPAAQIPPMAALVSAGVDYGTTNPFHAGLLGLGVDHRRRVLRPLPGLARCGRSAPAVRHRRPQRGVVPCAAARRRPAEHARRQRRAPRDPHRRLAARDAPAPDLGCLPGGCR